MFAGSVQTPFAQELVQQLAEVRQAVPAGLHSARLVHWPPAQPRPAQHSEGVEQVLPDAPQLEGAWHRESVQASPMQHVSFAASQGALASPQDGGGVQTPFVQESEPLQHGRVGPQPWLVAPQVAGGTQKVPDWPSAGGSMQESAPLQQGFVPEQEPPVFAQVSGALQTLFVQESAPLQHGTLPEHAELVPAQTAGAVHFVAPTAPRHSSAALQQSALVAHVDPVPPHVAGSMQTFPLPPGPSGSAQAPDQTLQQSASWLHEAPSAVHDAAGVPHVVPAHTCAASQHGSAVHEPPALAQVTLAGGAVVEPPPPHPASAIAAANRTDVIVRMDVRAMRSSSRDLLRKPPERSAVDDPA